MNRDWNDCEIYSPVMHRRYFHSWKEKILLKFGWHSFFYEPIWKSGCSHGQLVLYIKFK